MTFYSRTNIYSLLVMIGLLAYYVLSYFWPNKSRLPSLTPKSLVDLHVEKWGPNYSIQQHLMIHNSSDGHVLLILDFSSGDGLLYRFLQMVIEALLVLPLRWWHLCKKTLCMKNWSTWITLFLLTMIQFLTLDYWEAKCRFYSKKISLKSKESLTKAKIESKRIRGR